MSTAARALAAMIALAAAAAAPATGLMETPELEEAVRAGELPPIGERLPRVPEVVPMSGSERTTGRHGGQLSTLMAKPKDIRMMTVYGYARLVCYSRELEIIPDILEGFDSDGDRVFTLRLRPGHRWSDGHPFTAEDFRYYWEDVANNEDLSPMGPPNALVVEGELPRFEVLDDYTVRYSWTNPNPHFLPALAGALPLYIYRPAHYMKQFHARYVEADELERRIEEANARTWAGLHAWHDRQYRFDNPPLPTLQPWYNTTAMPSERFVFVRNPFYHRVDDQGRQLPYIDRVIINVSDDKLVPAKAGAGESDLQARYLRFDNYTFLKAGEQRNEYTVRLWRTVKGSQIALYPNLNAEDPTWRRLLRDVRFRRALSLAINRHEINEVVYYGLVIEGANTVLPQSPLFREEYQEAWADFDLERANALLDQIGLTERDGRGVRLLPDGRPIEIVVDTAGESTEETDVLELVHDSWLEAGVKLYTRPSQRQVFRNRVFSGQSIMSVWSGLTNGVPTASMSPEELAPSSQQQLQWPMWGQYYETRGQAGHEPELETVRRLARLNEQWERASSREERERVWHEMLRIHAERVYTIGTVTGVLQPVVVANDLRNVPETGIYNWDPGAYFGIYKPDTFWFGPTGPGMDS